MGEKTNIRSRTMQPKEKRLNTEGLLIPKDIIMDILSRLPVKSLIRFKLVSKSFNSLISDAYFVKLHLCRNSAPNANPRIVFEVPQDLIDYNINYLPVKTFLETDPSIENELQPLRATWKFPHLSLGSCNGLMCVTNICSDEQLFWVILWNPATRETSQQFFPLQIRREYDDSILYSYCGFGYDHVSDTYKVMKVVEGAVLVFNMGDFDERQVGYFPPDLICLENIVGVHFNGTLNWLVTSKINKYKIGLDTDENNIEWDNSSCMILSFNLNKEEFVRLVLPAIPYKFCDPHLGVLGECLCVSVRDNQFNFVIWQMKEFGVDGSWSKLLNINYEKELKPRDLPPPWSFPLYMFDNGVVLMLPEMFLYNHRDKTVDPLDLGDVPILAFRGVICCESLISPSCKAQLLEELDIAYKELAEANAVIKNLEQERPKHRARYLATAMIVNPAESAIMAKYYEELAESYDKRHKINVKIKKLKFLKLGAAAPPSNQDADETVAKGGGDEDPDVDENVAEGGGEITEAQ